MLTNLRLQNFRSYKDASFEFLSGVNIIVGPNASGKTNILEAIVVLARGLSFRAKDSELTEFGKPWFRLDTHIDGRARTIKLQTEPLQLKTLEIDGKTYKRIHHSHTLPVVLFEPNDLRVLAGGPERRRNYLDDLLEQTTPGYGLLRRQYKRTLAQRNALLKKGGAKVSSQLFAWDVRLSQLAGQIVRARCNLTEKINTSLPGLYEELAESSTGAAVSYFHTWPVEVYESSLLKKLEASAELDYQRGFTGHGPHREDMLVMFDGRLLQEVASRGEVRTAMLALKIIELRILEAARQTKPLLLLDDVFSELDSKRRRALTEHLSDYQAFITTTDADIVLKHFAKQCHTIKL